MSETICGIEFKLITSEFVDDSFWVGCICNDCKIQLDGNDKFGYNCVCGSLEDLLFTGVYKTKEEAVQKILDQIKSYCNNRTTELWAELKTHSNIISKINNL